MTRSTRLNPTTFPICPLTTVRAIRRSCRGRGHFDHLETDTREFGAAHLYGSVRRVLDIGESYLGHVCGWHFAVDYPRLELIPLIDWDNAQSGYGYMEMGRSEDEAGGTLPYALNFDVIAHEVGHMILFGLSGVPAPEVRTNEFYGFHESVADLTALISMLHFDTVTDRLLRATKGNLYTLNELNRIAELSDNRQIRLASNSMKMSDVAATTEAHALSRPLTGAVFDILVEIYQTNLFDRGLIDNALRRAGDHAATGENADRIQAAFAKAYQNRHFAFKAALADARDIVGVSLAGALQKLSVEFLRYRDFAQLLVGMSESVAGGKYADTVRSAFAWREIIDTAENVL